jgi:hypothetical protein
MYNFDFEENEKWKKILELTHAVWKVSDMSLEDQVLKNKIKDISNNILVSYTNHISKEENGEEREIIFFIDSLIALLSLAQKISSLREINFLILKNEYKKIKFALLARLESKQLNQRINLEAEEIKKEKTIDSSERIFESDNAGKNITEKNPREDKAGVQNKKVKTAESKPKAKQKKEVSGYVNKNLNQREGMLLNFFKVRKEQQIRLKDVKKLFPKVTDRTIRNDLKDLCNKGFIERSQSKGQGSFYYLTKT